MSPPNSGSLVFLFCQRMSGVMFSAYKHNGVETACLAVFVPSLELEEITRQLRTVGLNHPMMSTGQASQGVGVSGLGVMCWWPELTIEKPHVLLPDHWSVADLWLNAVHSTDSNAYVKSASARLEPIFEWCLSLDIRYAGAATTKTAHSCPGAMSRYQDPVVNSLWCGFSLGAVHMEARANELAKSLSLGEDEERTWYITKFGWVNFKNATPHDG